MRTALAFVLVPVLLVQDKDTVTLYDGPIDEHYRLRVTAEDPFSGPPIHVWLVHRDDADQSWELATFPAERGESSYAVERADAESIVFSRKGSYNFEMDSIKLFFDVHSKRELSRIVFDPSAALVFPDDAEARRVLNVSVEGLWVLRARAVFRSTYDQEPTLPEALRTHPLPQTPFAEFARLRPTHVPSRDPERHLEIEEKVGAYQLVGDRIWVGKTFYDGEGMDGVGALGYLDTAGRYTFLQIPELVDWSVAGLLVEAGTIWAGLVNYPEGAPNSGGLLEYDRQAGRARVHPIPDIVHAIVRVDDVLVLGTTKGIYVVRDDGTTRHRAEPDVNGQLTVVSERYR